MTKRIDINCDLGEGSGNDREVMPYISSCSIACGGHFGTRETIVQTLQYAEENDVKVGAHPAYPDPENFMFLLYGPNGKANNQGENASNYQNRRFDMLFSKMKNLPNGEKRQKIIDEMVDILQSDSPWLFGFFPRAFSLHHSWYKNASPHLMANNTLKYKGIDFQERQRMRNEWNRPVLWPIALITVSFLIFILPAIRYYRRRERRKAI